MTEHNTIDKIALYLGGGLVVLGVVVIDFVELFAVATSPAAGGGQSVSETLVPIELRSYVVLSGFLVWGLYAIYRVTLTTPEADSAT